MQLFKATNKESNHLVVVWACYCFGKGTTWQRGLHGDGVLYAVFVLKRQTMYVCVAPRPSERSRWVKSIFVLGSLHFRWKWNTWWREIVITHLQSEWQTIAAVKFSHISPALYSWLPSTLWPSLSLSTSSQLSQSLSTSSMLPFLPGIFSLCLNSLIRWVWERTSPDNTLPSLLYPT